MLILGIESSCDDTAAAVVDETGLVLSSVVSSQDEIHGNYGGIVPELASRSHIEQIVPVVETALKNAGVSLDDIVVIGVTRGPGLVGSILIGLSFAKAVSHAIKKPYVGVNHLEAHPLAAFLRSRDEDEGEVPEFPFLALVVSGGHTSLMLFTSFTDYSIMGQTRDDAAGEAFDKAAKLMGLGYPGGVEIDRLAKEGDASKEHFTRPLMAGGTKRNLDFSFSGIKTAVMLRVKELTEGGAKELAKEDIKNISAGFQEAVVEVLVKKTLWAAADAGVRDIVVSGGVACNSALRAEMKKAAEKEGLRLFIPLPKFCSDNGAMVAFSAAKLFEKGVSDSLDLNAEPNWKLLKCGAD